MEEKKLVPKRRFRGFEGEWEKSNFGTLYDVTSGHAFKISEYVSEGIPIINGESIQNGRVKSKNLNFLPESYLEKYTNIQLKTNDIVLGLNRPIINNQLKISMIPDQLNNSLLYQRAGKILNLTDIHNYFSYKLLEKEIVKFVKEEAVGSDQPFISTTSLRKTIITLPKKHLEQQKIGKFFKVLDERIANQERKIAKVKALKEAYLTEMFPQEGENVPKRRFAGFEGEWLGVTIRDTMDINSGMDYKHLKLGDIPVYGTGGYMLSVNDQLSTRDGIGIGRKGTIDKTRFLKAPFWTVDTLFYMIPKKDYDIYYLYYLCNTIKWRKYDESTGVPSLSKDTIENISIMTPIIEEQQKIGKFFKNLDDQIQIEEAKLEKLKKTKEAYLEEMFV